MIDDDYDDKVTIFGQDNQNLKICSALTVKVELVSYVHHYIGKKNYKIF